MERMSNEEMRETGEGITSSLQRAISRGLSRDGVSIMGSFIPWRALLPAGFGLLAAIGVISLYWLAPRTARDVAGEVRHRVSAYTGRTAQTARGRGVFLGWLGDWLGWPES